MSAGRAHATRMATWWWGVRAPLPPAWLTVLAEVFGRSHDMVAEVAVFERSRFARAHLGAIATTRPGAIHLAGRADDFWRDAVLVLHEYRHVLDQWGAALTRAAYLREALRHGYAANAFERDAIAFAQHHAPRAQARLRQLAASS